MSSHKEKVSPMPRVSVIVPNYNHSNYLNRRIDSILQQTYQNFEIILLDDASSDSSCEILRAYAANPKVSQLLENKDNSGNTFSQWAKGGALAAGDFIWIAESDDWAEPEFLENLVPLLDGDDSVEAVFCRSRKVNHKDDDLGLWEDHFTAGIDSENTVKYLTNSSLIDLMLDGNCIPNASAVLIRKRAMSLLDDNIKSYRLNGDWIFWIKLLETGSVGYCSKPLNNFRNHTTNVRNKVEATGKNLLEYLRVIKFLKVLRPYDKRIARKVSSIVRELHLRHARSNVDQDVYVNALNEAAELGVTRPGYRFVILKQKLRSIYNEYSR
jgi:glycosyltransferase involved in cell wall biosynthesis